MSDVVRFLAAPFAMCVVLAGIHCYLGLHVLARGVVFVDLSLAQVAAFGATLAVVLGHDHHSPAAYFFSLGSTFVAAAIFARAREHEKHLSQEAVIGVVYALASAAVVLVVDRAAHGAEHIKDILVGHVLWVTWSDVAKTAAIYLAVAIAHWVFRRQLIASSFSKHAQGLWDFVFYALLGVVITSSVSYAGILQVFVYLIVPAMISQALFSGIRSRLVFGWIMGVALSLLSLWLSYAWDMPSGALIVVCFALMPILTLWTPGVFRSKKQAG